MEGYTIAHVGEDGAFYLQIAHNIATGHGVTFDGIHPTTGVHWGWLLLLSGWLKLFSGLWVSAAVLYLGLLLVAAILVWAIVGGRTGAIAGCFLVFMLGNRGQWLMETNLVLVTLALFYIAPNALTAFMLVLARFDLCLFVLVIAYLMRRMDLLAGAAVGVLFCIGLNFYVDGHLLSIAGHIKAGHGFNGWPAIWLNLRLVAEYYFPWLPILMVMAIIGFARAEPILRYGFVACLLMLVLYIVKDKEMAGWYLAPLLLTSLLLSAPLLSWFTETRTARIGPMRTLLSR